jgi:hypothetical protein
VGEEMQHMQLGGSLPDPARGHAVDRHHADVRIARARRHQLPRKDRQRGAHRRHRDPPQQAVQRGD